ncbi:MAG TPA: alpha/beta hydrolase, partial [Pseudolysinimonas sp.]|nr:alpha/beta hydrolase [Pseudolysinimonas sp.]
AHTIPEYGEDLLRVAADLGWDEFSLVGHSMGGKAIQYALALAPRQVKCLVGVTPVPASGSPMPDEVIGLFRAAVTDADSRRLIFDMSTGHQHDGTWLDEQVAASMVASGPEANRSYLDSWTTGNFADRVAGIDVPVLVVVGKHDGGITASSSQETWGPLYPNLTIAEIDGAGHYPVGEAPAEFAAIVGDFLSTHG